MTKFSAADLAADFDRSFALAHAALPDYLDVLVIDIASERYALRVSDVAGVFVDRAVTRVPATRAELVGIAGFRGAVVPVFDLAALLGHSAVASPRWLVILAASSIALAFERFGGHLRVPRATVRDVVEVDGAVLPLIDIAGILAAIAPGK